MKSEKLRILVADDEKETCRYIARQIQMESDLDIEFEFAHNRDEAIEKLDRFNSCDIMLVDLWMPDRTGVLDKSAGIKILQHSKNLDPPPDAITITANSSSETALETSGLGVYDYIPKPIDYDRLIDLIREIIINRSERKSKIKSEPIRADEIIGNSKAMIKVMKKIGRIASSSSDVLIYGETGSGKDLIARAIHKNSDRRNKPFVIVNCSAIPSELIEAELFGIGKRVATSVDSRIGKFQEANGGTIFLDEIGDLSPEMQPKLLRALDYKEIQGVGLGVQNVDVRVIAATNRDLLSASKRGEFRPDLFYRLNFMIELPPLRDRKTDISLLADHFLKKHSRDGKIVGFDPAVISFFEDLSWEGNVRELEKVIEFAIVTCRNQTVHLSDLPEWLGKSKTISDRSRSENQLESLLELEDLRAATQNFERIYLDRKLRENDWNVQTTAEQIGIARQSLHTKIKSHGLRRSDAK